MVFFAWSPALLFAASFFAFEQAVDEGRLTSLGTAAQRGRNLDGIGMLGTVLADALGGDTDEVDVESIVASHEVSAVPASLSTTVDSVKTEKDINEMYSEYEEPVFV